MRRNAALLAIGGVFLTPLVAKTYNNPWASASFRNVEIAASTGDRHAELELGRRYEEGDGVPSNLAKAIRYYRAAANTVPQVTTFHPPVAGSGHVIIATTMSNGPREHFPEAEGRLKHALEVKQRGRVK